MKLDWRSLFCNTEWQREIFWICEWKTKTSHMSNFFSPPSLNTGSTHSIISTADELNNLFNQPDMSNERMRRRRQQQQKRNKIRICHITQSSNQCQIWIYFSRISDIRDWMECIHLYKNTRDWFFFCVAFVLFANIHFFVSYCRAWTI